MPSGQSVGTKITWDDTADKQFLMAIIKAASPTLPKFETVAAIMDNGVTAAALTNRWQKLKKQIEGAGDGAGPQTPSKFKSLRSPKTTPGSAKRKVRDVSDLDDAEDVEEKKPLAKKVGDGDDTEDVKKKPLAKKVKVEEHSPGMDNVDSLV